MKRTLVFIASLALFFSLQGCGKLFGLRPDLDDRAGTETTSGGVWPERGMLEDSDLQQQSAYDDYVAVGHSERNPAVAYRSSDPNQQSWVPQEGDRGPAAAVAQGGRRFKNGARATRSDFWDDSQNEGSLWASTGQTNYFFTKNSIKSPGDIITLTASDQFIKDTASELKRTLSDDEKDQEVDALKQKRQRALASADATKSATDASGNPVAADPKAPAVDESDTQPATFADVDLTKSIGVKTGDTLMAEIVERYPSGNYKIRGTKRLNYHGTSRLMTFVGIARASDISETDSMDAGKLYEYRLNVQQN